MKPLFDVNRVLGAVLVCSLATACGGGGGGGGKSDEPDTIAPTIVSTSPAIGAIGQYADVSVTIVFSEPMNAESVENTLDTSGLGEVFLVWNVANDTLTIDPQEPLEYAYGIGADPAVTDAYTYTVVLGNAAQDLAGNSLGEGTVISFQTLKSMEHVFAIDDVLSGTIITGGVLLLDVDDEFAVGDTPLVEGIRTMLTFDIGMLPTPTVAIASATLATRQVPGGQFGLPYGDGNLDDGLGSAVILDHVSYAALDGAAFNSSSTAYGSVGEFCIEGQVVIEVDVTGFIEDDRANRADRGDVSQFLLRFAQANDGDGNYDAVTISRGLTELQVTYLVP